MSYSYFTRQDAISYEYKWGLYIDDLVHYLKLYFVNATKKNLHTQMTGPFSRLAPSQPVFFRGTVCLKRNNEERTLLILELCELFALTQQTQYIFTWLTQYSPALSYSIKIDAMLHIWQRRLPHSHQVFYLEMYKLYRDIDWRLAIHHLQRLCRENSDVYHLVECCESVISQLMIDNAHELTTCVAHGKFYRQTFSHATAAMQQLMTHNFGRPLEFAGSVASVSKIPTHQRTLTLSSLAFDTLYQFYEYRVYLNVRQPLIIRPRYAMSLLQKMTTSHEVRLINLIGVKVSANMPYLTDKSIPTIQKMVVAGDWLYDSTPPSPPVDYIKSTTL